MNTRWTQRALWPMRWTSWRRPLPLWAAFGFSLVVLLASPLPAAPPSQKEGFVTWRYSAPRDYVRDLSAAIYRRTENPEFRPPDPSPNLLWEPRPATIIQEYTGVKRPEGAQVYFLASSNTLVVEGDIEWQRFIISLHRALGIRVTLK